jgi:Mitochondrial ATP synthase epsilon chain
MSGPVLPVTTFWRLAGMSYLQVCVSQPAQNQVNAKVVQSTKLSDACALPVDLDDVKFASRLSIKYVTRSAQAVRGALKEPARRKVESQEIFSYKAASWKDGVFGTKTEVTSLGGAGKVM